MTEKIIENAIQAAGKTAPRITPDHIESVISECHFFTAGDAHRAAWPCTEMADGASPALDLLTFCVLVLKNGFTVTGESACASPENFDAEIGRKIASDNARNKIWALEGYLLKQKLTDPRNEMIKYIHDAMREGYQPMSEIALSALDYEDLKIEHGRAWQFYNTRSDNSGQDPQ